MKLEMKKTLILVFIALIVISGIVVASDNDLNSEIASYKKILTSSAWRVHQYTAFPYHDLYGNGVAHHNLISEHDQEVLDDEWVFNEDGTYFIDQVNLKHEDLKHQIYVKGEWDLIDNGTVLEMKGLEWNGQPIEHIEKFYILELGPHSIKYFNEVNRMGLNLNIFMELIPADAITQKVLNK